MSNCILCGRDLTDEEIELGFDICEHCEEDDDAYGGFSGGSFQTKMRVEREPRKKTSHRPRGIDKFDNVDTREYNDDD